MWADFKKFISRGNVIDLAIGVVMGTAFGAIVNGLVNDIVMPVIGFITAGINFTDLKVVLRAAELDAAGKVVRPENALAYGHLIQVVIQFLIIALTIFLVMRLVNKFKKKEEDKPAPKAADVVLLEEIRHRPSKPPCAGFGQPGRFFTQFLIVLSLHRHLC